MVNQDSRIRSTYAFIQKSTPSSKKLFLSLYIYDSVLKSNGFKMDIPFLLVAWKIGSLICLTPYSDYN